jgi:hypothetical protein
VYYWGIEASRLFWADMYFDETFYCESDLVSFYWTHVAVTVTWHNDEKVSAIKLWAQNDIIGQFTSHHMVLGFPGGIRQEITLGTVEDEGIFIMPYRGYIFTFNIYNKAVANFGYEIQTEKCLGDV